MHVGSSSWQCLPCKVQLLRPVLEPEYQTAPQVTTQQALIPPLSPSSSALPSVPSPFPPFPAAPPCVASLLLPSPPPVCCCPPCLKLAARWGGLRSVSPHNGSALASFSSFSSLLSSVPLPCVSPTLWRLPRPPSALPCWPCTSLWCR